MLYMVLYTLTSLPMMPRPGTQALVVSRADKIYISALFASSLVRNNIFPLIFRRQASHVASIVIDFSTDVINVLAMSNRMMHPIKGCRVIL